MIGSERNTVGETKRYAGHTEKVSGLNELKNLAIREKLEVWGINSTLGIYKIAVYLWNSANVVGKKINVSSDIQEIISFHICQKCKTCMQKISKQLTTFTDHRRKGESLWLKKFLKKT